LKQNKENDGLKEKEVVVDLNGKVENLERKGKDIN
jgi:hypothetical protein